MFVHYSCAGRCRTDDDMFFDEEHAGGWQARVLQIRLVLTPCLRNTMTEREMIKDMQTEAIKQLHVPADDSVGITADDYYARGNAYRQRGDWQHAIDCYLEAISLDPNSPAVQAKQMLDNILDYYCKDIYNP